MIYHRAASGTRTRTAITGQGILSPSCLPIPPLRQPLQTDLLWLLRCKGIIIYRTKQVFSHILILITSAITDFLPTFAKNMVETP